MYTRCKIRYTQTHEPIYKPVVYKIKSYLKPFSEFTQISEKLLAPHRKHPFCRSAQPCKRHMI